MGWVIESTTAYTYPWISLASVDPIPLQFACNSFTIRENYEVECVVSKEEPVWSRARERIIAN